MDNSNKPTISSSASSSTTVIAAAIITLVIGLVIGFGVTKAMDKNNNNKIKQTAATASAPTADTKAADLRASLVSLGVQHMDLTDQAVDAALDGTANATATKADLIANGESISAAIGSVYGQAAQTQFQTLWNNHLTDFVDYAVADKTGDAAGKTAALNDIATNYTTPISKLLAGANPNLPLTTLETEFGDHVTMTAQMIDDHVQGNYTAETQERQMADQHMEGLMSTLADAIVAQYPAKF
jgi:hypothetical protein